MLYKTELHCHTSEISRCAHEDTPATVQKYIDAGYTTVVLTNHLSANTKYFSKEQYVEGTEHFISGYRLFKETAGDRLNVLLGAEVCLKDRERNDYLVFGLTEEFLRSNPELILLNLKQLHEVCAENNFLLIQAHPFRPGMTVMKPEYLDGIEVFNGHPGHNSHNDIADKWANYYNLIKTSGTDHHDAEHPATCGIATSAPITSNEQLVAILKTNDYRLLQFETPNLTRPHNYTVTKE